MMLGDNARDTRDAPRRRAKVLTIDDDQLALRVHKRILFAHDYDVTTATNAEDGLLLARTILPDVILLDWRMPGIDGLSVCNLLHQDPLLKAIPVVVVSGVSDAEEHVRSYLAGAAGFLTKPVDSEELVARLRTLASDAQHHQEAAAERRRLEALYVRLHGTQAARDQTKAQTRQQLGESVQALLRGLETLRGHVEKTKAETDVAASQQGAAQLAKMVSESACWGETAKAGLGDERVSARRMLLSSVDSLAGLTRDHSVQVHAPAELHVSCDPLLLQRVVQNLLSNAVKFSPGQAAIELSAEDAGDEVKFTVRDAGPGVPISLQDTIFDRHASPTPDREGRTSTGLGLPFCKWFVQNHGGDMGVRCPESGGSEFWFTLPRAEPR